MRVADPNPVYCSACFQQQPTKVHIDFEVAWDGPVINEDGLRVPIDDLYLCENCLETAYNRYRLAKGKPPIVSIQGENLKKENLNSKLKEVG
jgi:hypothetical protein